MPLLFSSYTTSPTAEALPHLALRLHGHQPRRRRRRRRSCRSSGGPRRTATPGSSRRSCSRAASATIEQRHHRSRHRPRRLLPPPRRRRHVARLLPARLRSQDARRAHRRRAADLVPLVVGRPQRRRHLPVLVELPRRARTAPITSSCCRCSTSAARRSSSGGACASSCVYAPIIFHRSDRKRTVDVVPPLVHPLGDRGRRRRRPHRRPVRARPRSRRLDDGAVPDLLALPRSRRTTPPRTSSLPIAGFHHHTGAARRLRRSHLRLVVVERRRRLGRRPRADRLLRPQRHALARAGPARLRALVRRARRHADDRRRPALRPHHARRWRRRPVPAALRRPPRSRQLRGRPRPLLPQERRRAAPPTSSARVYVAHGPNSWAAGLAPHRLLRPRRHALAPGHLPARVALRRLRRAHAIACRRPLLHRRDGDETADALFPLLLRAPLARRRLRHLAHRRLAPPRRRRAPPWSARSCTRRTRAPDRRTNLFFPLLTLHDSPHYSVRVLFPIVWRVHDGDETDTAIFPLYFRGRAPDHGWDGVFPLFIHAWNQTRGDHARRPDLVSRAHRRRQDRGPLPAARLGQEGRRRQVVVVVRHARRLRRPQRVHGRLAHLGARLLPLHAPRRLHHRASSRIVFAWRRGTASKVLTPIYYRQSDSARDYSLDVFTLLFAGHEGKSWKFGLFPLFLAAPRRRRRLAHAASSRSSGRRAAARTARRWRRSLGGYSLTPGGKRIYVGPFYYRNDAETTSGALLPARLLRQEPHVGRAHLDGAAAVPRHPPQRRPPARRLHAAHLALPQRRVDDDDRPAALLRRQPLRRVAHDRPLAAVHPQPLRGRRATAPTPFRRCSPGGARATTQSKTDAVVFPLFWHFGGKNSTTIVAPLVWDFKRGESRTTVAFPIFAHWHRPERDGTHRAQRLLQQGPRRSGRQLAPRRLPARAGGPPAQAGPRVVFPRRALRLLAPGTQS